ncbi:MAG: hypothetical protein QXS93_01135 [Candidatus Micrarchaeia archaeon]
MRSIKQPTLEKIDQNNTTKKSAFAKFKESFKETAKKTVIGACILGSLVFSGTPLKSQEIVNRGNLKESTINEIKKCDLDRLNQIISEVPLKFKGDVKINNKIDKDEEIDNKIKDIYSEILFYAVVEKCKGIIDVLLEKGADINYLPPNYVLTGFSLFVKNTMEKGYLMDYEYLNYLVGKGANPYIEGINTFNSFLKYCREPFMYSPERDPLIKYMVTKPDGSVKFYDFKYTLEEIKDSKKVNDEILKNMFSLYKKTMHLDSNNILPELSYHILHSDCWYDSIRYFTENGLFSDRIINGIIKERLETKKKFRKRLEYELFELYREKLLQLNRSNYEEKRKYEEKLEKINKLKTMYSYYDDKFLIIVKKLEYLESIILRISPSPDDGTSSEKYIEDLNSGIFKEVKKIYEEYRADYTKDILITKFFERLVLLKIASEMQNNPGKFTPEHVKYLLSLVPKEICDSTTICKIKQTCASDESKNKCLNLITDYVNKENAKYK